jgi:hypothetical protein
VLLVTLVYMLSYFIMFSCKNMSQESYSGSCQNLLSIEILVVSQCRAFWEMVGWEEELQYFAILLLKNYRVCLLMVHMLLLICTHVALLGYRICEGSTIWDNSKLLRKQLLQVTSPLAILKRPHWTASSCTLDFIVFLSFFFQVKV